MMGDADSIPMDSIPNSMDCLDKVTQNAQTKTVTVKVTSVDRPRLLLDLVRVASEYSMTINSVDSETIGSTATFAFKCTFPVETFSDDKLKQMLNQLLELPSVRKVQDDLTQEDLTRDGNLACVASCCKKLIPEMKSESSVPPAGIDAVPNSYYMPNGSTQNVQASASNGLQAGAGCTKSTWPLASVPAPSPGLEHNNMYGMIPQFSPGMVYAPGYAPFPYTYQNTRPPYPPVPVPYPYPLGLASPGPGLLPPAAAPPPLPAPVQLPAAPAVEPEMSQMIVKMAPPPLPLPVESSKLHCPYQPPVTSTASLSQSEAAPYQPPVPQAQCPTPLNTWKDIEGGVHAGTAWLDYHANPQFCSQSMGCTQGQPNLSTPLPTQSRDKQWPVTAPPPFLPIPGAYVHPHPVADTRLTNSTAGLPQLNAPVPPPAAVAAPVTTPPAMGPSSPIQTSLPGKVGRKVKHVRMEDIRKRFHMPIKDAARDLGTCQTIVKRVCRQHGIERWPHRQIQAMQTPQAMQSQTPVHPAASYRGPWETHTPMPVPHKAVGLQADLILQAAARTET